MSKITWSTPKGAIATVKEGNYFEYQLFAKDSQELPITYTLISGTLGSGLQLFKSGLIQGVPTLEFASAASTYLQVFTVRATNTNGSISDRTFSITINELASPTIIPEEDVVLVVYDGVFVDMQLEAIELNPSATLTWTQAGGELPPGLMLTAQGRLFGNLKSFSSAEAQAIIGWANTPFDATIWDSPTAQTQTRTYQFKVMVSDGVRIDKTNYIIKVQAKSLFTVDNTSIMANDGIITVDTDNKHLPYITTIPENLPEQRQDSNFAFRIEGEDLDGDEIWFSMITYGQAEFDQGPTLDRPNTPGVPGDPAHPADLDDESLLPVVPFDYYGFDQEGQSLPPGIVLDPKTGWLTGHLAAQVEDKKTYSFTVFCYKKQYPDSKSKQVTFTLTVLGDRNNVITWVTPEDLGNINNGSISEISIVAVSSLGKKLNYRLVEGTRQPAEIYSYNYPGSQYDGVIEYTPPKARSQLPQGLKLLPDGLIVGRAAFDYFSLDTGATTIDKNVTEFDNEYEFSITASNELDGYKPATVYSTKTFKLKVHNWNLTPYENIYLRALPNRDQRIQFAKLIDDATIFPTELIYRPSDEWFGKAKDIKFLFAAGLAPSLAGTYVNEMKHNHYNKVLNLSNVKTAVALDENFNVKYEVVYVAVEDALTENGKSPAISMNRSTQVKPPYNTMPFTTIYPNSLDNMKAEVSTVGYANKGALPGWMINQQENGRVLGFTRGVVLAYTKPGASKLIAFRLSKHDVSFNKIDFIADRYQLDHTLSKNFDIATKEFIESKETTFDRLPQTQWPNAGSVDFAFTIPFNEINGRTLEYIARMGGIEGATIKTGQRAIFYIQRNYSVPAVDDFAITKDLFGANGFDYYSFNYGTVPKQYDPEDLEYGWHFESGAFGAELYSEGVYSGVSPYHVNYTRPPYQVPPVVYPEATYYDDGQYAESSIVPGFEKHANNPAIPNMRSGIWEINVSEDKLVTLNFVNTVNPMEYVTVGGGGYGGTKLQYNTAVTPPFEAGLGPQSFTLLSNKVALAGDSTRFDGGATSFYSNKDEYAGPGVRDAFLKFPKHGIYR